VTIAGSEGALGRTRLPPPAGRQSDVVYLDAERDQVVLGTAGSGKTLMAIHRAVYLSDPRFDHSGRTLLVTYNRSLVSYLNHLAGSGSGVLDIRNYHTVARGYLASRGLFNGYGLVVQGRKRSAYLAEARVKVADRYEGHRFFQRPTDFFLDELDWISGHGYAERAAYLSAERVGRLAPLGRRQREVMWEVREEYLAIRAAGGEKFDWWELPTAVRRALIDDESPRIYKHIVIDEGQDLPPEAIRSLAEMLAPGGSITMFADYAQQLYGQRTSFVSCGLRILKVEEFRENYRNSVGIAQLAIATAALPHFTDSTDLVTPNSPKVAGTPPTLFRASDNASELAAVRTQAQELSKTGSVAILGRTWANARHFAKGLLGVHQLDEDSHIWTGEAGIYIGTYHSAKGLEFDAVILPWVDASVMPDRAQVEAFGEAEALERDARLLYVGITRARSELLATYTEDLTELLPAADSGFWLKTGVETP